MLTSVTCCPKLRFMRMDVCGPAESRGCVVVGSSCYHQRPFGCLWFVQPPASMLMSVGHAAVKGPVDVSGLSSHLWPCLALWSYCVDVRGPCYHQRAFRCPWSVMPPEIMLMSVGQATTGDHSGVVTCVAPKAMLVSLTWAATKSYDGAGGPCFGRGLR